MTIARWISFFLISNAVAALALVAFIFIGGYVFTPLGVPVDVSTAIAALSWPTGLVLTFSRLEGRYRARARQARAQAQARTT